MSFEPGSGPDWPPATGPQSQPAQPTPQGLNAPQKAGPTQQTLLQDQRFEGTSAPGRATQPANGSSPRGPLVKQWWFWVIIVAVIAIAVAAYELGDRTTGASAPVPSAASGGDSPSPTAPVPTAVPRPAPGTATATLGPGVLVVGEQIPAGRYLITPAGTTGGTVLITDAGGPVIINETLGSGGVPSVTSDLKDGDTVRIGGGDGATFAPASTASSSTLTPGTWIVGPDTPGGNVGIAPADASEAGNVKVARGSGQTVLDQPLGGDSGSACVVANLKDGDVITVTGLGAGVKLTPNTTCATSAPPTP